MKQTKKERDQSEKRNRAKATEELRNNPINLFTCSVCKDHKPESFNDFIVHCRDKHNTEIKGQQAKKQMLAHIDYDDRYSYQYLWTLENGRQFQQYVELARDKRTMMF